MKKIIATIILIMFVLSLPFVLGVYKPVNKEIDRSYSQKLLRLHVIANSDSQADQDLKREVRDAIIKEMNSRFKDVENIEETKKIVKQNLDKIEKIAEKVVKQKGKDCKVKAEFGEFPFPVKRYGIITLPAGKYDALRVVIGEGRGQNWWCVLFPPLCFIDITHGLTDKRTKEELKKVLSDKEYKMVVTSSDSEEIPIQVRFKILDVFNTIKTATSKNLSNQVPPSPK